MTKSTAAPAPEAPAPDDATPKTPDAPEVETPVTPPTVNVMNRTGEDERRVDSRLSTVKMTITRGLDVEHSELIAAVLASQDETGISNAIGAFACPASCTRSHRRDFENATAPVPEQE